jgi:ADP-ribose pyrophosphatase YjhB (NUDIX family)
VALICAYLLVEAQNNPREWVLPKGHIEDAETPLETAVREVLEETGVWACLASKSSNAGLDDVSYTVKEAAIRVRFFLMKDAGRGPRKDLNREHVWLAVSEAIEKATHQEAKNLLRLADQRRLDISANWPFMEVFVQEGNIGAVQGEVHAKSSAT